MGKRALCFLTCLVIFIRTAGMLYCRSLLSVEPFHYSVARRSCQVDVDIFGVAFGRFNKMVGMELTELSEVIFLRSHVNRRLSIRNAQLATNCEKVRKSFEKLESCQQIKFENEKSELQRYQELLQGTTGHFVSRENSSMNVKLPPTPASRQRRRSIATSVCMDETSPKLAEMQDENPADESRNRSRSISEQPGLQKQTTSSQQKRLLRRRSSLSLLELQRLNTSTKNAMQKTSQEEVAEESLEQEEGFTRDEEEYFRIPPPVYLPPIHTQAVTQLKERKFAKDKEFRRKISGAGQNEEELKYCRYLRRPCKLRQGVKSDFRQQKSWRLQVPP